MMGGVYIYIRPSHHPSIIASEWGMRRMLVIDIDSQEEHGSSSGKETWFVATSSLTSPKTELKQDGF